MEAIPLCLLLNKPHLFSVTQHRFILIQFGTCTCVMHVSVCTEAILRHGNTIFTKILQRPFYDICTDLSEDGLSTGRNMHHTCTGNKLS
jgi:hypothetical protein